MLSPLLLTLAIAMVQALPASSPPATTPAPAANPKHGVTPTPTTAATPTPAATPANTPLPLCVIELFTSEGCSSCPPADALARTLTRRATESTSTRTILLAFHVDYWDSLGWKDRFASPQATQRQREYAQKLSLRGLYTPQMVVNGATEFIGSDAARAEEAMRLAWAAPVQATIALKARWVEHVASAPAPQTAPQSMPSTTIAVTAKASAVGTEALANGALLDFMLVEDDLVTEVRRGENAGRTLQHARVVRDLQTVPLDASGAASASLHMPTIAVPAHCRLVALLREPTRLALLGADEVALPPTK